MPRTSFPTLATAVDDGVEALRAAISAPSRVVDPVADSATMVAHLFTVIWPPGPNDEPLEDQILSVVAARRDPTKALMEHYERYAANGQDPIGLGPLVPSGLLTRAEWDQLAKRTLSPLDSIVPALRAFTLHSGA